MVRFYFFLSHYPWCPTGIFTHEKCLNDMGFLHELGPAGARGSNEVDLISRFSEFPSLTSLPAPTSPVFVNIQLSPNSPNIFSTILLFFVLTSGELASRYFSYNGPRQRLANFFWKGPDNKHLGLWGPSLSQLFNFHYSSKASIDDTGKQMMRLVFNKMLLWTWLFKSHILLTYHKIVLFWFLFNHFKMQKPFLDCKLYKNRQQVTLGPWTAVCQPRANSWFFSLTNRKWFPKQQIIQKSLLFGSGMHSAIF